MATALFDLLRCRADTRPDRLAYSFLLDEGGVQTISFAELDRKARSIAVQLTDLGLSGQRALLLYPTGLDFIAAFWGCMYAGVVAVPAIAPSPPHLDTKLDRLEAIVSNAAPGIVLTEAGLERPIAALLTARPRLTELRCISTSAVAAGSETLWREPDLRSEDLAFLQYTSGSTGPQAKGVMISQGNLLSNLECMNAALELGPQDVFVSWIPLFHNMGLIGTVFGPSYCGMQAVVLSPPSFLKNPGHWLQTISDYRGTLSVGPNLGYELCVRAASEQLLARLDLSCWQVAMSGSEPVRAATLDRFAKTFARCGFRSSAFRPAYGLAEATVFGSGLHRNKAHACLSVSAAKLKANLVAMPEPEEPSLTLVGNGRPWLHTQALIVEPDRREPVFEGIVGEIWLSGPSVSPGYWMRPEDTEQTFGARLSDGRGPFLRTGDLGFFKDDELFICGRLKDLIIIAGANHYPQDIEWSVERAFANLGSIPINASQCAAFSIEVGAEERLVIAVEASASYQRTLQESPETLPEPSPQQVASEIRRVVAEEHELPVYDVVLLHCGALPRTNNGKIQRQACRAAYLDQHLDELWREQNPLALAELEALPSKSPSDLEHAPQASTSPEHHVVLRDWLRSRLIGGLKTSPQTFDPERPFSEYGLDSIVAMRLTGELERYLGRRLPAGLLWDYPSFNQLCAYLLPLSALQKSDEPPAALAPNPGAWDEPFALNEIQQAYWLGRGQDFELGNVATFFYAEFEGQGLELERLERGWQRLVERHGMLRAVISSEGQQSILPSVPAYRIAVEDLSALTDDEQRRRLLGARQELSHRVLPCERWPLFDIRAHALSGGRTRIHIGIDLLIADVSSILLLFEEWRRLYSEPSLQLQPLELSFRDYVLAQRHQAEGARYEQALDYWRARLGSLPSGPELPLVCSPSQVQKPRFVRRAGGLSREGWARLKSRAEKAGLTPSIVLFAAYASTLKTWSKSPRFTLNLTLFRRDPVHPQVDALVGDFTSLVLLEVDSSRRDSFLSFALQLQKQLWRDLEHRAVSGTQVLRELAKSASGQPSRMPVVFTSALGVGGESVRSAGWLGQRVYSVSQTPQVWLDHQVLEEEGALLLSWDAVEQLFPEGLLDSMFEAYLGFVEQLAQDDSVWLEPARLVPSAQLAQRFEINATHAPQSSELLHLLFERQALVYPDKDAVVSGSRRISYRELAHLSGQLAALLREHGVLPNQLVAIVMEKGWEQVVGCLAVLKAGAAYLPIDPSLPQARVSHLLQVGKVQLALTQSWIEPRIQWPSDIARVAVDKPFEALGGTLFETSCAPTDLAYAIFTSGSTGVPKGVMIDHRGAVNTLLDINERMGVGPSDQVLGLSSLSFDLSVYDLFGTLAAGATLVFPDAEQAKDPLHWLSLVEREGITVWNSVPALMKMFVEALDEQTWPETLRLVMLSGDWIPVPLAERLAALPTVELWSLGGATEASIWSICYRVAQVHSDWRSVPYGRPMRNQSFHVLDEHLEPRPVWVPGELFIGGVGVALGYWGDEKRTKISFLRHPSTGERLYWTGDLGRYLPDGNIEFLGREDTQVKVQGFRIELGEIETTLREHPSVREAIALAREAPGGERHLVAYVVLDRETEGLSQQAQPVSGELKAYLEHRLPSYMVPRSIVELPALPLTSNGKVDRRSLPEPKAASRNELEEAPRNAVEQTLATIWQELLHREHVGVHDNFFELGGDSILVIQVVSRAARAGLRLSPRQLFERQTIAELASIAELLQPTAQAQKACDGSALLGPVQHWFFDHRFAEPHHWNQSLLLSCRRRVASGTWMQALQALGKQHDSLRFRYQKSASGWGQSYAPETETVELARIDLSGLPPDQRLQVLEQQAAKAQASLLLEKGPLVHAVLFELGTELGQRLLLVAHHLVVDGVSWRVLLEDLQLAVQQLESGQSIDLGPKTSSFARWTEHLAAAASAGHWDCELSYWRSVLEPAVASLPKDALSGDQTVASSDTVTLELDEPVTQALLQQANKAYRTEINDLLLAALGRTLAHWSRGTSVLLSLEGHGREPLGDELDLSRTVGWFTSMYPVRLELAGLAHPKDLLRSVKEQLRQIPGHGLGFGALRYMGSESARKMLAALAEPEVSFNYLGQVDGALGSLFELAKEPSGSQYAPSSKRAHLVEIYGMVSAGRLQISWVFDTGAHRRETILSQAGRFMHELQALVDHCLEPTAGGYSPSDFPLSKLDQCTLDEVLGLRPGIDGLYPLSSMQEGLLFHSLREGGQDPYVVQVQLNLGGPLHEQLFCKAWQQVIERHSILRTSFLWDGLPRPLQRVHREVELTFERLDWHDCTDEKEHIREWLSSDRNRGFDFLKAPLMRVTLIALPENRHCCVWTFHHLIADGWSLPLVLDEVFCAYCALREGSESVELWGGVDRFEEFIAWFGSRDRSRDESFWREHLRGFDRPIQLPLQAPSSEEACSEPQQLELRLSVSETQALLEFAKAQHLTLGSVLQGAWAVVVGRCSGQSDIVFGSMVSGRPALLSQVEQRVGVFINSLPLRVQLSDEALLGPWLSELQQQTVALREFEATPLVDIQSWSELGRGQKLFDSLFILENYPLDQAIKSRAEGLNVLSVESVQQTTYGLTVVVVPDKELTIQLAFDGQKYAPQAIRRLLSHYQVVLRSMLQAEPSRCTLGQLQLLDEDEKRKLLVEWNDTERPFASDKCIHELFEEQVERTPDRIAVQFGSQTLSFQELERKANGLAHQLLSLGVGPGTRVGLCLERSLEMVICMLGVLKAGAAYVPLDPEYPQQRLAFLIQDASAQVLLTQRALGSRLPKTKAVVLYTDGVSSYSSKQSRPRVSIRPEALMYILYTSGSTGAPKGAMLPHRALVNHMQWMQRAFPLSADDKVLQKTPFGFDASVWEFWAPLLSGARLVMAEPGGHRDGTYLVDVIRREGITVLQGVPSLLKMLLETPGCEQCSSLRLVFSGGELLTQDLARALRGRFNARVINLYGPTEAAIDTTWDEYEEGLSGSSVPIGRPIDNAKVYVLDSGRRLVPIGSVGELHIGGAGVGLGYWNQDELTAKAFVTNPFSLGLLYRTGDFVRWRDDGRLEFVGRGDDQVKVRGFRIELGEIEAAIRTHKGVRACVALVREEPPSAARIVAYVEPERGAELTSAELRESLAARLPSHMVPAAIVLLGELPLLPSGKVDRKALPAPSLEQARPPVEARNEVERALSEIWAEVLGVPHVGIEDNFFDLGGDSILSLQVVSRARRRGLELTPRQLFEAQTISRLAEQVGRQPSGDDEQGLVTGQVPLTPIMQWFFEQKLSEPQHWNQAVLLRPHRPLKPELLDAVLQALEEHHDALRLRFVEREGAWQAWQKAPEKPSTVRVIDLQSMSSEQQSRQLAREAAAVQASLSLDQGPLMRAALFGLSPSEQRLLLVVHHLAVDGVSWRILLEDLNTAYVQLEAGKQPTLGRKTCSYRAWAEKLRQHAHSPQLLFERAYWERLSAEPFGLLPLDRSEPEDIVADAETIAFWLEPADTQALIREAGRAYRTDVQELLLSALAPVLASWTGSSQVLLALESHGREGTEADLSRTVGWFTSVYPALLKVSSSEPGQCIKAIKEQLRAIPSKGLGFGLLRYPLGQAAPVSAPHPEVLFNYLGQFDGTLQSGGLFSLAHESPGPMRAASGTRAYRLEVDCLVQGGRLCCRFTYSSRQFERRTIERVAEQFANALGLVLAHCQTPGVGGPTPSDFPLVHLEQAALDRIAQRIGPIESLYPLSPMQAGMLFHGLIGEGKDLYFGQLVCELQGLLEPEPFREAWRLVMGRHPVLRTAIVRENLPEPLQAVLPQVAVPMDEYDWREASSCEESARLEELLAADRARGFALEQAPLMRLSLIRLRANRWVLVWSSHHVIMDGWSVPLVLSEVLRAYRALVRDERPELGTAGRYEDFIALLARQDLSRSKAFWREYLAGFTSPTPLGQKAEAEPSGVGATAVWREAFLEVEASTLEKLQTLTRERRITLSTLVQGAWALLLARQSGHDDVLFGITLSGRPMELPAVERTAGLFIHTVPLRVQVDWTAELVPWLEALQRSQLTLHEHGATPLVEISRLSELGRGQSLFGSLLVFENYPLERELVLGTTLALGEVRTLERTNYPLTVAVMPGQSLRFRVTYDLLQFSPEAIANLLGRLRVLLEEVASNPARALGELPLMTAAEREALLQGATRPSAPVEDSTEGLSEAQVEALLQQMLELEGP